MQNIAIQISATALIFLAVAFLVGMTCGLDSKSDTFRLALGGLFLIALAALFGGLLVAIWS